LWIDDCGLRIVDRRLRIADCGLRIAYCGLWIDDWDCRSLTEVLIVDWDANPQSTIHSPQSPSIGLFSATMLVVGNTIGVGIFTTSGVVTPPTILQNGA
jgi:hypothetical protein